ncbi:hypothetical protein N7471_000747 [Penicillium samsonianum]|uniref:uncharacterized protein n=1 Tax=Penicillium samsonianum TaxID=1882272 RepID=UPI00254994E5|nr:uncharacterized protein N7471_000747 [Penicillium samsonianum]KAJ6149548.1 hypothetical protein N7471_000747 [Penicillium samsonianum]
MAAASFKFCHCRRHPVVLEWRGTHMPPCLRRHQGQVLLLGRLQQLGISVAESPLLARSLGIRTRPNVSFMTLSAQNGEYVSVGVLPVAACTMFFATVVAYYMADRALGLRTPASATSPQT